MSSSTKIPRDTLSNLASSAIMGSNKENKRELINRVKDELESKGITTQISKTSVNGEQHKVIIVDADNVTSGHNEEYFILDVCIDQYTDFLPDEKLPNVAVLSPSDAFSKGWYDMTPSPVQ